MFLNGAHGKCPRGYFLGWEMSTVRKLPVGSYYWISGEIVPLPKCVIESQDWEKTPI